MLENIPEYARKGLERIMERGIKVKSSIQNDHKTIFDRPPFSRYEEIYHIKVKRNSEIFICLHSGWIRMQDNPKRVFVFEIAQESSSEFGLESVARAYGIEPVKKVNGRLLQINKKPLGRIGKEYFVSPVAQNNYTNQ